MCLVVLQVVNLQHSDVQERVMLTGRHMVRDVRLQELQQQGGLALRVCHRGQPALQGGPCDPGEGAGEGERGLRTDPFGLQLLNLCKIFFFFLFFFSAAS